MKCFSFLISGPEGDVFRDDVTFVSLRGEQGDLAIMAGHVPFVTSVKPCNVEIDLSDKTTKKGHTDGGILTVDKDIVTLISGTFKWIE